MPSSERVSGMLTSAHLPGNASRGMPLGNPPGKTHLPGNASWGMPLRESPFRASPASARSYPELLGVPCMTFYRLHFSCPFRTALERHFFALGSEKPPKMEPKPSQNPVENVSKIDLMLRRLKSESEQTLPHFCSF